jgi:hypothetical protein
VTAGRFAPMTRLVLRQATTIRRLRRVCDRMLRTATIQAEVNERLSIRLEQVKRDLLMVAQMVPQDRRREALEFVATAEDIRKLDELQGEAS